MHHILLFLPLSFHLTFRLPQGGLEVYAKLAGNSWNTFFSSVLSWMLKKELLGRLKSARILLFLLLFVPFFLSLGSSLACCFPAHLVILLNRWQKGPPFKNLIRVLGLSFDNHNFNLVIRVEKIGNLLTLR